MNDKNHFPDEHDRHYDPGKSPTIDPELIQPEERVAADPRLEPNVVSQQNAADFQAKYQETMNPVGASTPGGSAFGSNLANQTGAGSFPEGRMQEEAERAEPQVKNPTAPPRAPHHESPYSTYQGAAQQGNPVQQTQNFQNYQNPPGNQARPKGAPYQQPGYFQAQPHPHHVPPRVQPTTTAYVGMGLSIASLILLIVPGVWLLVPILAIAGLVISIMENKKQKTSVSLAGIICSAVTLGILALVLLACGSCAMLSCGTLRHMNQFNDFGRFFN